MMEDANRLSAVDFGWDPTWFGLPPDEWGTVLEDAIREYQDIEGLNPDGWCDEATLRRLLTDRACMGLDEVPHHTDTHLNADSIVFGGQQWPIAWDRVVTPGEPGALELPHGKSKPRFEPGGKLPDIFVMHWDVTSSAAVTHRVLRGRKLSSHFAIDWDGTIYQYRDLAWSGVHAGGKSTRVKRINQRSWAVDLNSPVRVSRQDGLIDLGQPARPELNGDDGPTYRTGNWKPKPFLGMHQVQLDAFVALAAALHHHWGFPLVADVSPDPLRLHTVEAGKEAAAVAGYVHHAEVTSGKWDTLGVNLPELLGQAGDLSAQMAS